MPFDANWLFVKDSIVGAEATGFDDSKWRTVNLPHDWSIEDLPNQATGITGGRPELIGTLARAAVAAGADGIFLETHPNPALAKSDGANMLKLDLLEELLTALVRIRKAL